MVAHDSHGKNRITSHLIFIFACIYISVFIFSSTFVIVFYFHFDFDFVFNSISTFIFTICKFIIVFMFTVVFTFIFIFVFICIYICLIIFILISCLQNFYYSKIHCSFFYYKSSFIIAQRCQLIYESWNLSPLKHPVLPWRNIRRKVLA